MPAVHRESYLNGLRRASREGRFKIMVKVLHQMHCYTASLDWGDYGDAKATLQSWVEFIRRGNAPLLGMSE